MTIRAYEICNTWADDMDLEQQIEEGINDWRVDLPNGAVYFAHTAEECEACAHKAFGDCRDSHNRAMNILHGDYVEP